MAKILTGVQPGGRSEAEIDSIISAPTEALQAKTPQASAAGEFSELFDAPPVAAPAPSAAPEELAGIMAGATPEPAAEGSPEEQLERERVMPLSQDLMDRPGAFREWNTKNTAAAAPSVLADGGMLERAGNLAAAFNVSGSQTQQGLALAPVTKEARDALKANTGESISQFEAEGAPGTLSSAMHQVGGFKSAAYVPDVDGTNRFQAEVDPVFLQVGSLVTENMLSAGAFGDGEKGVTFGVDEEANEDGAGVITKATGNAKLGQDINREWKRLRGEQASDIPPKEAAILGDAFKEMYAAANPSLIKRGGMPGSNQVYFQVTETGQAALKASATERKHLFPKQNIRPSKTPLPDGKLIGDALQSPRANEFVGKVKQRPEGQRVLEEAAKNLSTVPHVVNMQRTKIMYAMALPMLMKNSQYADNFGAGASKEADFQLAAETMFPNNPAAQSQYVQTEMALLRNKLAQEIRAVAQERNGANYLTYSVQAFNGRIAPQQTYFDPTSSKIVRFVTTNAVPAPVKKGGPIEKSLRQMYAMMLVPSVQDKGARTKADALLPAQREQALQKYEGKMYAWGKELRDLLDSSFTDAQYQEISEAIEAGAPLDGINFPTLDIKNEDLVKAIQKKGEDGPHLIDGLIDYANYRDAMAAGKTYHSYFNAYIDGKTNGIASNGIQMGNYNVAAGTGVIRNNVSRAQGLYLDNDMDIRDKLAQTLLEDVDNLGWGDLSDNVEPSMTAISRVIYNYRDLNKGTTMTFGYGKELSSFKKDIGEAVQTMIGRSRLERLKGDGANPELAAFEQHAKILDDALDNEDGDGRSNMVKMLHQRYTPALASALSTDALASRAIMRGAAVTFALMDQLFTINSATGFKLNLGAEVAEGADASTASTYNIYGTEAGKQTVYDYKTRSSSAAARAYTDNDTGEKSYIPGEHAYGGSLPGPVQSMDAATVALTSSGKSWSKLKARSNGNPYLHTIYDAFKMDAMGYSTVLEEVNKNWLEAGMKWSYLEETQMSIREGLNKFKQRVNQDPRAPAALGLHEEFQMLGYLLQTEEKSSKDGGTYLSLDNMRKKMMSVLNDGAMSEDQAHELTKQTIKVLMKDFQQQTGYNWQKPTPLTVGDVYTFVKLFAEKTALGSRLEAMKNKTNRKKERLNKIIKGRGLNNVLQYYAH